MGEQNPHAELMRLANGYQVSQAIHVAAALGIADLLGDGPRGSDDLAAEAGVHPGSLYRLLRALAAVGVFREEADRRFSLAPMGRCLRSDAERPVGPYAAFVGRPYQWSAWGHLLHGVRTGETAFRHVHGADPWEYRSRHPEEGAVFDRAMTAMSRRMAQATISAHDFSRYGRVVDVGGGHGAMLAAVLAAHPAARGILFDQPSVVAGAAEVLRGAGVAERCEVVGGDFFERVPGGGDAYLLKTVLHDWDDATSARILSAVRATMPPGSRVVLVEQFQPRNRPHPFTSLTDLQMLTQTDGGRERSRDELRALLAGAGLTPTRVVRVGINALVEGVA